MSPEDGAKLYKVIIKLSMQLRTGVDYFMNLSLFDLKEIMKEVAEIGKEQRIRAGNKNSRRN